MNRIVATAALSLSLAPFTARALVAQDRPDFSGTWVLDAAESRMIGHGGQSSPAQLGERRITWRVEHREPDIAVTITVQDPDRPHEFSFRCTTDGRACVNELPELREVREMSARWSGAVLLMTQHARTPHGSFDAEDRLSLSDSGRALVFDRIVRDERGQRSVKQVFRRVGQSSRHGPGGARDSNASGMSSTSAESPFGADGSISLPSGLNALVVLPHSRLRFKVMMYGYWNAVRSLAQRGRGTMSDQVVAPRVAELLRGEDPVLERALALVR